MSVLEEQLIEAFSKSGFAEKKTSEIIKNKKVAGSLFEILTSEATGDLHPVVHEDKTLLLLHQLAVESKGKSINFRELVTEAIIDGRIKTNLQISEAVKFIASCDVAPSTDAFNESAGVGVDLSQDDVRSLISDYMTSIKLEIESNRYSMLPKVLGEVKKVPALKWAAPQLFKPTIDALFLEFIGPKDERDVVKKEKKKTKATAPKEKNSSENAAKATPERLMFSEGFLGDLHKPGDQPQKYPELINGQLAATDGKVVTRFPPEPNGFLHIGHSKAIMVNFGYAQFHGGQCILRYDDTNPEAEETVYVDSIKRMVEWLGYEPHKVTFSLDYFDELYELAEKLILADKAYVCHCTSEQVKANRGVDAEGNPGGPRKACESRANSIDHNMREFRRMRDGEYAPGTATLRMKQDLESPLPQMWDLVAYRVLSKSHHHRTGDKWRIYPTYDFTHCLVDSFENISHSLCTTEFFLSRELYEWLCDALRVYRPAQREYGRLSIEGTVLSKRKIAKLVTGNYVRGWDDPRLFTLEAVRRRGVPPGAILSFINTLGVTTSTTNIQVIRFESAIRNYLDQTTPRLMMVLNPIEVVIDNVPQDFAMTLEIPYKPGDASNSAFGSRSLTLTNKFYIDRDDFVTEKPGAEYFRLAPGQAVGLMRVEKSISYVSHETDSAGNVTRVHVQYGVDGGKPKTFIQWVPTDSIEVGEVRRYRPLFTTENPSSSGNFLDDIDPNSETVLKGARIEKNLTEVEDRSPMNVPVPNSAFNVKETGGPETVRFQALRVGYFCLDKESTPENLVLNQIVSLKEDSSKR